MVYREMSLVGSFNVLVLAEVFPDPVGGWGSLVLQAGAFGLLAYIVTMLYPRQQKEIREEREKRDQMFMNMIDVLQNKFNERNERISQAIKDQTVSLLTQMKDDAKTVRDIIRDKKD